MRRKIPWKHTVMLLLKQYFENGDLKKQFFVKTMHRKQKVQKPSLQKQNVQILLGRNNTSEQCLKGETIEKFYFRQFYY